jgi:hypothetical protein
MTIHKIVSRGLIILHVFTSSHSPVTLHVPITTLIHATNTAR